MRNIKQVGYIPTILLVGVCVLAQVALPDDLFHQKDYRVLEDTPLSEDFNEVGYLLYKTDLYEQAQKSYMEDHSNRGVEAIRFLQRTVKPVIEKNPELLAGDPIAAAKVFDQATYKQNTPEALADRDALHRDLAQALRMLPNEAQPLSDLNQYDQLNR